MHRSKFEPLAIAWRKHMSATVFGVAMTTMAVGTIAASAITYAQPNTGGEWDIGAYDNCVSAVNDAFNRGLIEDYNSALMECCIKSGGDWKPNPFAPSSAHSGTCTAPAAGPPGTPPTLPGQVPHPGSATQNPAAPLPPVRNPGVTQPFTPAPVG
jgi:hypothetical protein